MARFPQACGKTSCGPLVIFKRQNKGRVRSWERQKEEAGERQNKEPWSNLQNFDFLTHHSHPWDHGKTSQVLWGQFPMAWANSWLNLGTLAKVTSSGLCLMTDYSKRNLLWIHTCTWKYFRTLPLASSRGDTQCLVSLLDAIPRDIFSCDSIWGFWDLPTAAKIVIDFTLTLHAQKARGYRQYQETFYAKVQIINFSSVAKQLSLSPLWKKQHRSWTKGEFQKEGNEATSKWAILNLSLFYEFL